MQYLPVLSATGERLMPCHAARARQLIRTGKAVKRFDRGICYLVLTERQTGATQPVALGIDPGSKKEAYTVQGERHTLLNLQADAITWVGEHVTTRRHMRRARRYRNTPCRANRQNRARGGLPPSTRARWGWKLRITRWLARYYPLTTIVIEDIAAVTKAGKRRWNQSFSPLEVGKQWCYTELAHSAPVMTVAGYQTKALRDQAGLTKSRNKLSDGWDAHCVDSFVLASYGVGGASHPTNTQMLYVVPLRFHRRQLHRLQPAIRRCSQTLRRNTQPGVETRRVGAPPDVWHSLRGWHNKRTDQSARHADGKTVNANRKRIRLPGIVYRLVACAHESWLKQGRSSHRSRGWGSRPKG